MKKISKYFWIGLGSTSAIVLSSALIASNAKIDQIFNKNNINLTTKTNEQINNKIDNNTVTQDVILNSSNINFESSIYSKNDLGKTNLVFNPDPNSYNFITVNNLQNQSQTNQTQIEYQTQIEFDLNVYKPIGLDDDIFLKNTSFEIEGVVNNLDYLSSDTNNNYEIKQNINENDFASIKVNPEYNWDTDVSLNNTLYVPESNITNVPESNIINDNQLKWRNKLIFNFFSSTKNNFKNTRNLPYAYLYIEIAHKVVESSNINSILIRPKLIYCRNNYSGTLSDYNFKLLLNQKLRLKFKSNYFLNNDTKHLSANSYISDKQRFNLYSTDINNNNSNNQQLRDFISLDTSVGNNEIILSQTESLGSQIPPLNIDTSNFYLDDDTNHKQTKFKITISGIQVKNAKFTKTEKTSSGSIQSKKSLTLFNNNVNTTNNNLQNTNLEIVIDDFYDSYFDTNKFLLKKYTIPGNVNWNSNLSLDYFVKIVPKYDEKTKQRIPFHYEINEIKFKANNLNNTNVLGNITTTWNCSLDVCSSSSVVVKIEPKDYNYIKMVRDCENIEKGLFEINETYGLNEVIYSSNIFDNHYIIENNKVIKTNYDRFYEHAKIEFDVLMNNQDFINIRGGANNPWQSAFSQPFVQTKYLDSKHFYRSKGLMELKYGLLKKNKFFDFLTINVRGIINNKNNNNHEIIKIKINQILLEKYSEQFKDIDKFVDFLNNNLDVGQKLKLINIDNLDNNQNITSNIVQGDIKFSKVNQQPKICAILNLWPNFYCYDETNYNLINTNIQVFSENINGLNIFNSDPVQINYDVLKIKKLANKFENYNSFINYYSNKTNELINISNPIALKTISFIKPELSNQINILVQLNDRYSFNNGSQETIISIPNINWLNQNNEVKGIKIDLNYNLIANEVKNFNNIQSFINHFSNPNITDWKRCIEFLYNSYGEQSNINQIESIRFETVPNSFRKLKVIIKAKDWYQFENINAYGLNEIEFVISNLLFKNENNNSKINQLSIDIDMSFLYELLVKYFNKNPNNLLTDFINDNYKNFIVFNNNPLSIIKIDPYWPNCLCSAPNIKVINEELNSDEQTGIYINLELNDGFCWRQTDDIYKNQYFGNFTKFISIGEIKQFHNDFITPNPQYAINTIKLNTFKFEKNIKLYDNIDQFIKLCLNNEYDISTYLIFNSNNDLSKIKNYKVIKNDEHSLTINIQSFDKYYFLDEPINIKTKSFTIHNLVFKNQKIDLKPVCIDIDSKKLINIVKNYNNVDELINDFNNKISYQDYTGFLTSTEPNGIKSISIKKGINSNSIYLIINLNPGYYFLNESPLVQFSKILIANLIFKNEIDSNNLNAVNLTFDGNKFLIAAKNFDNFTKFNNWLKTNNNFNNFFNLSFEKPNISNKNPIRYFDVIQTNENTCKIKLTLEPGYYFSDQVFTELSKTIIVGNLNWKNSPEPSLNNINIRFNATRFYLLLKDKKFDNWQMFIDYISKYILNFKDNSNAILTINITDESILNLINVQTLNDCLNINLECKTNYYFNDDDKSNIFLNLNYDKEQLNDFYINGKNIVANQKMTYDIIVSLSVIIPFLILITIITVWVIKNKTKNKKIKEEKGDD